MNNKVYDILKRIAMYYLPALATLYGTLSATWCLPYGEQIVATISAVDLFVAACLGLSSKNYTPEQITEETLDFDGKEE